MFDWILSVIQSSGYTGIFFLMVLENLFPPIPSEFIVPLAGFSAAQGQLSILGVLCAATTGSLVGAAPWYALGSLYGVHRLKRLSVRFGRFFALSSSDIDQAQQWFDAYGHLAVLFGRLVPGVRTLISVPAGFAKMKLSSFILCSLVGAALWNSILFFAGYLLESQYGKISPYVNTASDIIFVGLIAVYLYKVATYKNEITPDAP